jgi:hypothetical protein
MRGRKTGGRKKGTPNKTTADVREALLFAFDGIGGVPKLIEWGARHPGDFYRLWARLAPQDVKGSFSINGSIAERLDKALAEIEHAQDDQVRRLN